MTLPTIGVDRNGVLWLGSELSDEFKGECIKHGLSLRVVTEHQIEGESPKARMLLVEVPLEHPDFIPQFERLIDIAALCGLSVGLVLPANLPEELEPPIYEEYYRRCRDIKKEDKRVTVFYHRFWDRIAASIAALRPELGINPHLKITGDVPDDVKMLSLLKRAFCDEEEIHLKSLEGGKSGARVWSVERVDSNGNQSVPLVAKAHLREKISAENSLYTFVEKYVSKRHHATLNKLRCVEGKSEGLSVYDLIDNAQPFREALKGGSPAPLVSALFRETLQRSHSNSTTEESYFARKIDADGVYKVLHWSPDLYEAAESARAERPEVLSVKDVRYLLTTLPPMRYQVGLIHGDLHVGNLFVPLRTTEVSLIDFGRVSMGAPLALDPACLEVSLAFPPSDFSFDLPMDSTVYSSWLRHIYTYPISTKSFYVCGVQNSWLSEALRAVRHESQEIEPDIRVYSLSVAAFLMRAASFADYADLALRSLAFELSTKLISDVVENFK